MSEELPYAQFCQQFLNSKALRRGGMRSQQFLEPLKRFGVCLRETRSLFPWFVVSKLKRSTLCQLEEGIQ
jgi:hypothetical protein